MVGIVPNWCDSKKSSSSNFPPFNDLSATNGSCKRLTVGSCLVTFNATSKFLNKWRHTLPTFSHFSKKTVEKRNNIGDLIKEYAEKEGIMSQPRGMLISSFHLKNGTINSPVLLYYLHLGLKCTKTHQFVQYTQRSVSIALYSLPSMLEDKEMKIPTQA